MSGFFEARLAPIISDLSQVVVSLGLISVSLGYVNAVISDPGVVASTPFWIRVLALVATVAFTTYNLLTYAAEMETEEGDTAWAGDSKSPALIIALFLIDLLMLGQQGWMYGVLVLRDFSDLGQMDSMQSLRMSDTHFVLLAGFAAGWHACAALWHWLAESKRAATLTHIAFFALFAAAGSIAVVVALESVVAQAAWICGFTLIVLLLFFSRGRRVVANAIEAHRSRRFARSAPPAPGS